MATYFYDITDAFPIIDIGVTRQKYQSITDNLALTDTPKTSVKYVKSNDQLLFKETINYSFPKRRITLKDTLTFAERFGPTKDYRIEDILVITSLAEQSGFSEALSDLLEITDDYQLLKFNRNLKISDVITFREVIANHRFPVGSALPVDTETTVIDPEISNAPPDPLIPCYPIHTPTISFSGKGFIRLPAPNFGNEDTVNVARVNIRSRGNELIIFAPDYWSKDKVISYDINIYELATVKGLQAFVNNNLGTLVTLVDHEGNSFSGVILTGNLEVAQHNTCHWTTSLSFQKFV